MLRRAFASINHAAMVEFWDTTSKVSLTAAYLGRDLGVASINDAHTFALFRDCGAPLLMQKFPDYWGTMRSAGMDDAQDMADMECANYGTHHASVGATLAMSWHLPAEIGQSIQMHHENRELSQSTNTPNDKPAILVSLGILADGILRNYRDIPTSDHLDRESELAYKTLCVTHEDLDPLQSDIKRILSGE